MQSGYEHTTEQITQPKKSIVMADSNNTLSVFLCLPEELWEKHIVINLNTKDILSLLCVNKHLNIGLGQSVTFWNELSNREGNNITANTTKSNNTHHWRLAKESYLLYCSKNNPTKSGGGVQWYPVHPFECMHDISEREGHISCVLRREKRNSCTSTSEKEEGEQQLQDGAERTVVITGGFSNDDLVYLIHAGTGTTDTVANTTYPRWNTECLQPIGTKTHFVFGSSLTPLPTIYHQHQQQQQAGKEENDKSNGKEKKKRKTKKKSYGDDKKPSPSPRPSPRPPIMLAEMRALQFGGFRAGGFSNETSQVSMLSIKEVVAQVKEEHTPTPKRRSTRFIGRCFQRRRSQHQQEQQQQGRSKITWIAEWTDISCTVSSYNDEVDEEEREREQLSRAFHSATLLLDRYLVIIGGMKPTGSIINEMILDTHTWEWIKPKYDDLICYIFEFPSGRHGHSVVFDDTRNRLLMFGGGSGSSLAQSGIDNSEVWQLTIGNCQFRSMGTNWRTTGDLVDTFPWVWKKILHGERLPYDQHNLSLTEQLCLGRCHNCVKISRDTVLLFFGSGRISTNGIIAYDLKTDTFIQQEPEHVTTVVDNAVAGDVPTAAATATATIVSNRRHTSRLTARSNNYDNAGEDGNDGGDVTDGGGVYVKGILPKPKFIGVAAYLEEDGYIITHGGYCSQDRELVRTMDVLDLAPSYRRRRQQSSSTAFNGLKIDEQRVSYAEVTNIQTQQGWRDQQRIARELIQQISVYFHLMNDRY